MLYSLLWRDIIIPKSAFKKMCFIIGNVLFILPVYFFTHSIDYKQYIK